MGSTRVQRVICIYIYRYTLLRSHLDKRNSHDENVRPKSDGLWGLDLRKDVEFGF